MGGDMRNISDKCEESGSEIWHENGGGNQQYVWRWHEMKEMTWRGWYQYESGVWRKSKRKKMAK